MTDPSSNRSATTSTKTYFPPCSSRITSWDEGRSVLSAPGVSTDWMNALIIEPAAEPLAAPPAVSQQFSVAGVAPGVVSIVTTDRPVSASASAPAPAHAPDPASALAVAAALGVRVSGWWVDR